MPYLSRFAGGRHTVSELTSIDLDMQQLRQPHCAPRKLANGSVAEQRHLVDRMTAPAVALEHDGHAQNEIAPDGGDRKQRPEVPVQT